MSRSLSLAWRCVVLVVATAGAQPVALPAPGRERISLNDDWRFIKDDPPGTTVSLLYDVRPEAGDGREDRRADAEPERIAAAGSTVPTIKPWILPTANPFIRDVSKRHRRPDGNPGAGVSYVQRDFDDGGWRRVDLPHD